MLTIQGSLVFTTILVLVAAGGNNNSTTTPPPPPTSPPPEDLIYLNFKCGKIDYAEKIVNQYQQFKSNPNGFNVPKDLTTPSSVEIFAESSFENASVFFLSHAHYFRNLAITEMLNIEHQITKTPWSEMMKLFELKKQSLQCAALKIYGEKLGQQILGFKENLYDFGDAIDPDTSFEAKLNQFRGLNTEYFEFYKEISEKIAKYNELKDDQKKDLYDSLNDTFSSFNELRKKFLESLVVPEMNKLHGEGKDFPIQDQIHIRINIEFYSWISSQAKDIFDQIKPDSKQ